MLLVADVIPGLGGPWGLALMCVLVAADAFLVVVPGEIAVTAMAAVATSTGTPPLWTVIACAAAAALAGDLSCYGIGRAVGIERWRWMRTTRVRSAVAWAHTRLERGLASTLFTARFIPFARLAVNLSAGAGRIGFPRFAALAATAATLWALYQSIIGAIVVRLIPDNPGLAVACSVVVALAVGVAVDVVTGVVRRGRSAPPQ